MVDSDIDNKLVRLTELEIAEKGTKHLEASLSIVNRLGHYFEEATFDIKRKIIGSIFPEKLTFDGTNYRTTEINEVIRDQLTYQ